MEHVVGKPFESPLLIARLGQAGGEDGSAQAAAGDGADGEEVSAEGRASILDAAEHRRGPPGRADAAAFRGGQDHRAARLPGLVAIRDAA